MRLGARVVKIEPPEGESMRVGAPAWYEAINAGKEIVELDLKGAGLADAQELCDGADVILDGFRPGVFERLGLSVPERAVYCAITGFGDGGRHALRAGPRHQLRGLGGPASRHRAGRRPDCRWPISPQARSARSSRSSRHCSSASGPARDGASRSR